MIGPLLHVFQLSSPRRTHWSVYARVPNARMPVCLATVDPTAVEMERHASSLISSSISLPGSATQPSAVQAAGDDA
ncbi:MAG: hypothetical protein O3C21_15635 [Verrucomicrobia bacterium]|nr:hypothetical protein [Verrucomicrobiota bacterium]